MARIAEWAKGDFFLGDRLSLADLALLDVQSLMENFKVPTELPAKLQDIVNRVKSNERIAAWLAERPVTDL